MDSIVWTRAGLIVGFAGGLLLASELLRGGVRAKAARVWTRVKTIPKNPYQIPVLAFALAIGLATLGIWLPGREFVAGLVEQGLTEWQAWLQYAVYFVLGFLITQAIGYGLWRAKQKYPEFWWLINLPMWATWAVLGLYLVPGLIVVLPLVYLGLGTVAVVRRIVQLIGLKDSAASAGALLVAVAAALEFIGTL